MIFSIFVYALIYFYKIAKKKESTHTPSYVYIWLYPPNCLDEPTDLTDAPLKQISDRILSWFRDVSKTLGNIIKTCDQEALQALFNIATKAFGAVDSWESALYNDVCIISGK